MKFLLYLLILVAPTPAPVYQQPNNFRYITVERIYDGDTITKASIWVGDSSGSVVITTTDSVRLVGIDSREMNQPGGLDDKAYLEKLIDDAKRRGLLVIEMLGREKYGRIKGRIWGVAADGSYADLNAEMVKSGHARMYDGGKR